MARKCAFLDIDATAFKKLILSNVGSEEGGARQSGFPNAADKEDLYAKVRSRSENYSVTPSLAFSGAFWQIRVFQCLSFHTNISHFFASLILNAQLYNKSYNPHFHRQINFEAKRHGRKGTRMNSVESPSASLCSDGNSPTLTPPSSSSASNPPPARPPPHSLWSKSVEGSESECLIWSELVGCDLVKSDLVGWSLCDQTIWWPPLAKEASPYPCLKYQPAIPCSEIFSVASEMFSQIFSTSISRHSFSFLTVTDATIHGRCAQNLNLTVFSDCCRPTQGLLWNSPCGSIRTKYISTQDVFVLFFVVLTLTLVVVLNGLICEAWDVWEVRLCVGI